MPKKKTKPARVPRKRPSTAQQSVRPASADASLSRALASAPLLRGAPLGLAKLLLARGRLRRLVERELLLLPTQPNHTLYLLLAGRLHVLLGELQDTVVQLLPGTCVGEMSVIDGASVSAPVVAAEASTLLAIDTRTFWRLAERNPIIARNLLAIMAQRVRKTNSALRASLRAHDQQGQLARIDTLTSTRNRRWLDENLPGYLSPRHGHNEVLVVGMFDIDHFKKYNDTWGHAAGDAALQAVAGAVHDCLRPDDRLCRYGGEEFCLILPVLQTSVVPELAHRVLESIRRAAIESRGGDPLPSVTASLGLAVARAGDTPESLLHRADEALYEAKRTGRDRFVLNASLAGRES